MTDQYSLTTLIDNLKGVRDKTIVLFGGTYDLLHVDHLHFLQEAKNHGDILVVGVESDNRVRERKGVHRPIICEAHRAEMVLNLKPVDYVFINEKALYDHEYLSMIRPNIFVFGNEQKKMDWRKERADKIRAELPFIEVKFEKNAKVISTTLIESSIVERHTGFTSK